MTSYVPELRGDLKKIDKHLLNNGYKRNFIRTDNFDMIEKTIEKTLELLQNIDTSHLLPTLKYDLLMMHSKKDKQVATTIELTNPHDARADYEINIKPFIWLRIGIQEIWIPKEPINYSSDFNDFGNIECTLLSNLEKII